MAKKKIQALTAQVAAHDVFGDFRYIVIDEEIWFIGIDIAKILGYKNGSRDVNRHVDEQDRRPEVPIRYLSPNGVEQTRKVTLINESGLYSLILGSQLPTAKKFTRWVTSEVLPSIRKYGYYMFNQSKKLETDCRKAFTILAELDEKGIEWDLVFEDITLEYNEREKDFRPCYKFSVKA